MAIFLHNSVQYISDEVVVAGAAVILSYLLFIILSFIEKNHYSKGYKIVTSIFGFIALVPVFFVLIILNGHILAFAATVLFIAALVVHMKKLKYKPKK